MTVQELITLLQTVEDKEIEVHIQNGDAGGDYDGDRLAEGLETNKDKITIY